MKTMRINNKEHEVWIDENGNCFIDGKSVDEFLDTCSTEDLCTLARVGYRVVKGSDISPNLILEMLEELPLKNN